MNKQYNDAISALKKLGIAADQFNDFMAYYKEKELEDGRLADAREDVVDSVVDYVLMLYKVYGDDSVDQFGADEQNAFANNLTESLQKIEKMIAEGGDIESYGITIGKIKPTNINLNKIATENKSKKSAGSGSSKHKDLDSAIEEYLREMGWR